MVYVWDEYIPAKHPQGGCRSNTVHTATGSFAGILGGLPELPKKSSSERRSRFIGNFTAAVLCPLNGHMALIFRSDLLDLVDVLYAPSLLLVPSGRSIETM